MSPSVESMVMKLTRPGSDVPAATRSSVLMLKLRWTPQGAHTSCAQSVLSVACQLSLYGPPKGWVRYSVFGEPWK